MSNKSLKNIKIGILTLGCKVNSYESDAMVKLLSDEGADIVDFESVADVYIVNTCSVTNIADRKSRQMLHRAGKLNGNAVVIGAGCYIQALSPDERAALSIDGFVGNNCKADIVNVILDCLQKRGSKQTVSEVIDIAGTDAFEEMDASSSTTHTRAYIKIQDGCNQFCTYCIIPYTRGRIRSRLPENVISEARRFSSKGFKEIVLTGIHLSSYEGYTMKGGEALLRLMEELASIEGIERIRLGSLEPRVITEEFVSRLSHNTKVCPHFHLSLQSGSDTVLKRMNRKYTTQEYLTGCEILRKYYLNPAITTDIIVGFPQETDEEFEQTMEFARKVRFSKIHVFKYSRRKGTFADRMSGQVADEVKNLRSDRLISLEEEMGEEYYRSFIGKEQKVLLEETEELSGKVYLTGYTDEYVRIALSGCEQSINNIVTCVPTDFQNKMLICD